MCGCEGKPAGGTLLKALRGGGCGVEWNWDSQQAVAFGCPGAPAHPRQVRFGVWTNSQPPVPTCDHGIRADENCGACSGRGEGGGGGGADGGGGGGGEEEGNDVQTDDDNEELQLALALSQSQAESREGSDGGAVTTTVVDARSDVEQLQLALMLSQGQVNDQAAEDRLLEMAIQQSRRQNRRELRAAAAENRMWRLQHAFDA